MTADQTAYDACLMRRRWAPRLVLSAPAVALAVLLSMVGGAAPAGAKSKRPAPSPSAKPVPQPGWTVDRVRFEPLDAGGAIGLGGAATYRGAIEASQPSSGAGNVSVVNVVGLDDYLRGIAEVPSTWPAEALAAQAIAARTYALHQLATGQGLCATEACQVYAGLAKERSDVNGGWAAAVSATANQVVENKNGPILAMYSSSNGGRSVPGSQPYLRAVNDPDDAVSPLNHWQSTVDFGTLTALFAPPGPVVGIRLTDHDTVALAWQAANGAVSEQEVAMTDFVANLNKSQPAPAGMPLLLPSSRFGLLVDPTAATVTFDGHGFGHGVGMSQYGALGKALRGMRAADILASYYGGLRPVTLPAPALPATIPVTLAAGAPSVTVTSGGWFRVIDDHGTVLATAASGAWRVMTAAKGQVRVVPPDGEDGALTVAPDAVPGTATDATADLHYRLSLPALVRVTITPPGGSPVALPLTAVGAGAANAELLLPPGYPRNGTWTATVAADAGGGRSVEVPISFVIGDPPQATPAAAPGASDESVVLPRVPMGGRRSATATTGASRGLPIGLLLLGLLSLAVATTALGIDVGRGHASRFRRTVD